MNMKNWILIFFLLAILCLDVNAQSKTGLGIYTDRDVYVSGETLLAKIYTPESNPSKIVYMDLVNQYGTRISGVPLETKNHQASGYLQLPDSLSSGIYQLRGYQKNTAEKVKIVREIWISNRFDGFEKNNPMKKLIGSESEPDSLTHQIKIDNLNPEYVAGTVIDADIQIEESILDKIDGNLLVAVAQTEPSFAPATFKVESSGTMEGLNEVKGMILSGTVTDKTSLQPIENSIVYLTIPDSVPGFQYYKTRTDGRFYFLINQYHVQVQAVIQCFGSTATQRLKIKLDELYAEPGTKPKYTKQAIPEALKANITRNIDVVTLQKIFSQEKLKVISAPAKKQETVPYYGKPTQTVDPQLFIDLPDFAEISRELLPGVKFRNYNNEPSIRVMNSSMQNFFEDPPLVLIDGIPIQNMNIIKSMGSSEIDRVDICQSERYYGDLRFPGVVAIYTSKADYSKIPESDQLIHIKLEVVQPPVILADPPASEPNIPDLRQVLYWNPSEIAQNKLSVKCIASSISGRYKLSVRARLKNGTIIYSEKQFEVK